MESSEMSALSRILMRSYNAKRRTLEDVGEALNSGKITQAEYEEITK